MEKEVEKTRGTRERTGRSPRPSSVGTGTLEKKNKDLNKATKELEAKVKNLQQKTRSLPRVQSTNTKTLSRHKLSAREVSTIEEIFCLHFQLR